jgi:hypothetical protein
MMGVEFTNFHRTLATYVRAFTNAGFRVSTIREPTIAPEELATWPWLDDELRVQNFIVYRLGKPGEAGA